MSRGKASESEKVNTNRWKGKSKMPVGEVKNLVNKLEVEVRGKVATPRVGLCVLLLLLALLVSINIGLTLWLLFTVRLDLSGGGPLTFVPGGLKIEGSTQVVGDLVTDKLTSGTRRLTLRGDSQVVLGSGQSTLTVKPNTELRSPVFSISDSLSVSLLNISREGVALGKGRLTALSASLGEVLQAGRVKSRVGKSLTLESLTGRVDILGPAGSQFSSSRGNISIASHGHLRLQSNTGQIELVSQRVLLPDLPMAKLSSSALGPLPTVHQVCVCSSGHLFLSPSNGPCLARPQICNEK